MRADEQPRYSMEAAMGLFSKDIQSMDDLMSTSFKGYLLRGNQIIKALPALIDKATNRDLRQALTSHLRRDRKETGGASPKQVFLQKLGQKPKGVDCPAIDGLIKEADEVMSEVADKQVLDAAIVASAQAVEHDEIARYGTVIAWAEELGHEEIVRFLNTNLNEEKAANTKLNT